MRVLLVQSEQDLAIQGNNPVVIDKERGKNPPLGVLYVAFMIMNGQSGHYGLAVDCKIL